MCHITSFHVLPSGLGSLKAVTVSIGHIAHSCCYVVPVALLNKELRRQYCDMDVRSGIDLCQRRNFQY